MLLVENGTGLPDAEAFNTVAEFRDYCAKRGIDLPAEITDTKIEQWLREAAEYLCIIVRYRGLKLVPTQSLEFPRQDCVDVYGQVVTGVPKRLKDAELYLASEMISGKSLLEALERGGKISSESVGNLSVSYAPDAPAGTTFPRALSLIEPFVWVGVDGKNTTPSPSLGFTMPGIASFPSNHYED